MDPLTANLLDLLFQLEGRNIPVMIGGGYGLYLKRRHLAATGERTLFASLPEPRATNDLDMFLRVEVLSNLDRTRKVREAIVRLGYRPIDEARFFQWKRDIIVANVPQEMKIDILVGPLGESRSKLKVSMPRVRPRGSIEFHAHAVEEAVLLEEQPIVVEVSGARSTGEQYAGTVEVPEAFPYLMMKLHAFADRKEDVNRNLGRHHALDLYSIVGMMTEAEYDRAKRMGLEQSQDPNVRRARTIVKENFSQETGIGMIRLREHPLFSPDFHWNDFQRVLQEVFPDGAGS